MDTSFLEVQEIIKNLSISYDDDTIIDHRLSVGNKLRALGQAKKYGMNITYLATASNWRMMLNRQVNPNANPIFLIIPWTKTVGKKETNNFAQTQGGLDPETMSAQQYFEAFIRANRGLSKNALSLLRLTAFASRSEMYCHS